MAKGQNTSSDSWMFWGLYPAIALLSVHIGNENTFAQLLQIPSYYTDILFALLATYAVGFYLKKLHSRLQKQSLPPSKQFGYILAWGLLLPLTLIVSAEIVYLWAFLHIPLSSSSVFYLEMPVTAILLAGINLLYVLQHAQNNNNQLQQQLQQHKTQTAPTQNLLVHSGAKAINIPLQEVAYFFVAEKTTFLVTNGNTQHVYDETLDALEKKLPPNAFYKLNRQVITSRRAVQESHQTETRRLQVVLQPPAPYSIYVSKVKAPAFLKWLSQ